MIWLILLCFSKYVLSQQPIKLQLSTKCQGENEAFNTYIFGCTKCDEKTFPYNDYLKRCSCPNGQAYVFNETSGMKCKDCPSNRVPSGDKMSCMEYEAIDENNESKCELSANGKIKVNIETDLLGFKLEKKFCLETKINNSTEYTSTSSLYPDNVCKNGKIFYDGMCNCESESEKIIQSQNICIQESDIEYIRKNFPIDTNVDPALIKFYYYKAARDCFYGLNLESCQVISNLCVLGLYNSTSPACRLYNQINFNTNPLLTDVNPTLYPGWKKNMPWLYYKTAITQFSNAVDIIMNASAIQFEVSFAKDPDDKKVSILPFYMSKFYMNGTLVGFHEVNKEFILCTNKFNDDTDYRSFGNSINNFCEIDLSYYRKRDYEMFFYEVFLHDKKTDFNVSIPVVIDNMESKKEGTLNKDAAMADWALTRRFFLIDNVLGLTDYNDQTATTQFVTYAQSFKFVIQLQNEKNVAKIFVPYIRIEYNTRTSADIDAKPNASVKFISEYTMDINSFMVVCMGILIAITIVAFLAALAQMYAWTQVNPSDLYPKNYVITFIMVLMFKVFRFWGFLIFWFTWIISAYWYIFFKLQFRVFLLLPPLDSLNPLDTYKTYYMKFDIVFGVGCGTYALYIFYKIYCHATYDIYFVDWEQDKEMLEKSLEKRALHSTYYRYKGAWRLLKVINQFHELQKKRNISFYFCVVWVILMYYRVDWYFKDLQVPSVNYVEHAPTNYIIRHFVTSFIILICGITQFIIIRLLQIWIPLRTVEFLDLCSVSNISVFILTDRLRGYYIHGKSPLGKADANLDELLRFLEREAKDKLRDRGITDGENSDLQSFEMYMSYAMKIVYDGLYCIQVESSLLTQGKNIELFRNTSKLGSIFRQMPAGVNHQSPNYFNDYMNNQLKNKIETILLSPKSYVFDKLAYELDAFKKMVALFIGFPPSLQLMNPNSRDITLFKDPRMNFDEILFSGLEFEWFIFQVFLFQMWMRVLDNMEIAFFLTYVCERFLFIIRNIFVEKNIGKKAVVDTRFIS